MTYAAPRAWVYDAGLTHDPWWVKGGRSWGVPVGHATGTGATEVRSL